MPDNWWDAYPVAQQGPLPSPPKVEAPPTAIETRKLEIEEERLRIAKDEARRKGANPGEGYRLGPDGTAAIIPGSKADPITQQRLAAQALLKAAGVDLARGVDPISALIKGSTSGGLETIGAKATGFVTGDATPGMENIGKLQTIVSDMVLQLTGGSLGTQISNADREFIAQRVGNLADPTIPADQRLAAWQQVKQRMANVAGVDNEETAGRSATDDDATPYADDGSLNVTVTDDRPDGGGGPPPSGGGGPESPYSLSNIAKGIGQGVDSLAEGALTFPGMVINPVMGALGYKGYDAGEGITSALGLPENTNPTTDAILKGAGGAMTLAGGARSVAGLMNPGAGKSAMAMFGAAPMRDTVAGAGAGAGAEVARRNDFGVLGQLGGAMAGGLAGYGGAGTVASLMTPKTTSPAAQAAARQGVDMLPADAGGPVAKIITSGSRASPISATPVARAADRNVGQLSAAARRTAESQGEPMATDAAGEGVQQAAKRWNADTRRIGNDLYKKAWSDPVASALTIPARNSLAKIDELISELNAAGANTNAAAIGQLSKLRADLQKGMTAKALHDLRSEIRDGVYDGGLRSGADKGRMKTIGQAMGDDMLGYLDATGNRRTADTIRKADGYWQQRVEQIDQVLQPIIGKEGQKGGEQVIQTLEAMARGQSGGNKRLARLFKEMTPEEAGQVRATIIDRIGKATPGQQTAEGQAFSPATFLTNWNRMSPQAKETLFRNQVVRKNLDDIALLAEKMKATQAMANHSNTSLAAQGSAGLQVGWAIAHPLSFIVGAGAQFVTGKLMASPAFARLLAKVPENPNPAQVRSFVQQLGVLGTREPLLRQDALALQQGMQRSLGTSPTTKVAAEEERKDVRREPVGREEQ